jgi:hypothetical protein
MIQCSSEWGRFIKYYTVYQFIKSSGHGQSKDEHDGILSSTLQLSRSRDSSVDIATGYGLDDQREREFDSR